MLLVLSPAKTLDYESPLLTKKHSLPEMIDDSKELIDELANKAPGDIAKLMHLSENLAELNFERYQDWSTEFTSENARPAVLAFKGDVYMGMDVAQYSERDFTHAQKVVRILSGLHGVLRPLDLMQPYRLEMGTDLKNPRGKNLYEFWGNKVTDRLNADLAERKSSTLVNLASIEYFSVVKPAALDAKVVSPVFLDEKNGDYKIISFFAKRARGVMASWIVQNRVKSARALKDFDGMGYSFDPERSTPEKPTFIRAEAAK